MSRRDVDTNGRIAALLQDLASVREERESARAYRRSASIIFGLDEPAESLLLPDGTLRKLPGIGPKSEAVILEVLRSGGSSTVERAVEASRNRDQVQQKRQLRSQFLSRAQVLSVLADGAFPGPTRAECRADFQMHSTYSDGVMSLVDLTSACIDRGYTHAAVTDHSRGLQIAGGMTIVEIAAQHREIDRLNATLEGQFRLLKGIEANINPDGTIDLATDELKQLELVLAAPHVELRSSADQTTRMLRAVRTPGVHVLAHPRGRQFGTRAGVIADWDAVFAAAATANVAVEIDGDPDRQDLDYELAERAVAAGCLVSLDSDAHATRELRNADTAIAHARLAGIPTERVINGWPLERLLVWLGER